MQHRHIKVVREDRVVIVHLNRPEVLNALNSELTRELLAALTPLDGDPGVGCFLITGSERVFAAGADIAEMADKTATEMFAQDYFADWERFTALRTPKVAAVSGHALGGGCELAMMCDVIIAADNAKFGQPEITLGVIPGIGGTQRLTRLVGKAKAMDMILTGRLIDAAEADRIGLVSRVVPADALLTEATEVAQQIAGYGKLAAMAARDCVDRALETGLADGIRYERRAFHALFATEDQKEGMQAFIEKREATFTGK
jgi:enoyl-CoA hydratase